MYLHVTFASDDGKLEALSKILNSQVEQLKKSYLKLQIDLEQKDSDIIHLQKEYETLEKKTHENQFGY